MNKSLTRKSVSHSIIFFLFFSTIFGSTRVAFSRPGSLIRTPSMLIDAKQDQYHVGFSSEIINTSSLNSSSSIFFKGISYKGYHYGFAYSSHAQISQNLTNPQSDLSFHFGGKIYSADNMQINMGINDVLYSSEAKHQLSLYITLLNSNIDIGKKKNYKLQTALGFGTGKINNDSHRYSDEIESDARFFLGLNFKTPYLKRNGGVNLFLDFDGTGTHVGALIPVTKQLELATAITNFQNMGKLNKYEDEAIEKIFSDNPGISFGIAFKINSVIKNVPKIKGERVNFSSNPNECVVGHVKGDIISPLSISEDCLQEELYDMVISVNRGFKTLNDSIIYIQNQLNAYEISSTQQDFEIKSLEDSINVQYLKQRISVSELNIAMKHMTQSLQYYYDEQYVLALDEVEKALQRFPTLAMAYARKGSIYYQLGDLQKATINWNLALKHDPEYTEVQQMLSSIQTAVQNKKDKN
jgi:tetratricopeptide (TPR) repeat protein